jgi:hypothetical protein
MAKPGSNLQAALAVFWSFFGIRKRSDYDADAESLTPAQVILAGLIGAVVFIGTMLLVVYLALHFLNT